MSAARHIKKILVFTVGLVIVCTICVIPCAALSPISRS